MERLHPGVYIQEVPSGARPIEGVSTSTTAFVGRTQKGPIDIPVLVTNFTEYQAAYGGFMTDSLVTHAALQFFNNGGQRLYVARAISSSTPAVAASVQLADRENTPAAAATFSALNPGSWASNVSLAIGASSLDPGNLFKVTVFRGADVVETFDNLTAAPDPANAMDKSINGRSRYITVTPGTADPAALTGTSTSGASPATALSDTTKRSFVIEINGDGPRTVTLTGTIATSTDVINAINAAVRALPPFNVPATAYTSFATTLVSGQYVLTSGAGGRRSSVRVTSAPAATNAAGLLKLGVANGGTEVNGAAALRPVAGTFALSGAGVGAGVLASTSGIDGAVPSSGDFINTFSKLDVISDVNLVAIPGIGAISGLDTKPITDAGTGYCTARADCFFIGEVGPLDDTPAEVQTYVNGLTVRSSYGAVYAPWVRATDPTGQAAAPVLLPPSGYVAGIYSRIDGRRGVWKAPAGAEANLLGTVGLAAQFNDAQQDILNPIGANTIRQFASSGIVVWGARTLGTLSDPSYRYVPVRRLALFLERSIYNGIQWAVFEPNDENLWASLRLNIGAFMLNMFRAGAFQGSTPAQAFFVKCDDENNPQSEIDAGVVNVLIGFAPVKPAEFVVIKISQRSADAT